MHVHVQVSSLFLLLAPFYAFRREKGVCVCWGVLSSQYFVYSVLVIVAYTSIFFFQNDLTRN